jgi:hypothetical protein
MTRDPDAFQLFEILFKEDPKPPKTYNLRLEESNSDNKNVRFDDILINIFFTGIKILFGESVNLMNIRQEQYNHINNYMNSLGYTTILNYEYGDNNNPVNVKIWFEKLD